MIPEREKKLDGQKRHVLRRWGVGGEAKTKKLCAFGVEKIRAKPLHFFFSHVMVDVEDFRCG